MGNSTAILEFLERKITNNLKVNTDDALLITSSVDIISQILKILKNKFEKLILAWWYFVNIEYMVIWILLKKKKKIMLWPAPTKFKSWFRPCSLA